MKHNAIILLLCSFAACLTSCGWDVIDPEYPEYSENNNGNSGFSEVSGTEIYATVTSPGMPKAVDGVNSTDEQIHIANYGCEGNLYFNWKKGDVLYAVNQRTGEISEIETQQDDVVTALFTGYSRKGVQKGDTYLIYNKEALTPSTSDKTRATGNTRYQSGLPEDLKKFAAMAGTANALSYDKEKGVKLSETNLEHKMAFLHVRALLSGSDQSEDFAAMSLFAETTSYDESLKAEGATCISKYYNIQYKNNDVNIEVDESKDNYSYLRCTFPQKRLPVACTEQMINDDSRARGKYYMDCFMAINPENQYLDSSNGYQPVTDYIINLFSCREVIYNKHINMTNILKKLESGKIICMNIDMTDDTNTGRTDAITVPGFYFSLSPGYVCGHRKSMYDQWEYEFTGLWEDVDQSVKGKNQAIIRGQHAMNELYNEFFVWGGTEPEDMYYDWSNGETSGNHRFRYIYKNDFVDVATLCDDGYWRSFNKNELDVIATSMNNSSPERRSCVGYYESKEIDPTDGSKKTYHIFGLYIGTSTQPKYEYQDQYFFFPSCLDIADRDMAAKFTVRYRTPNGYEDRTFGVGTPAAVVRYNTSHKCNGVYISPKFELIDAENLIGTNIFISIWSGAEGEENDHNAATAYRVVYDAGQIRVGDYSKGMARFVRGVRY